MKRGQHSIAAPATTTHTHAASMTSGSSSADKPSTSMARFFVSNRPARGIFGSLEIRSDFTALISFLHVLDALHDGGVFLLALCHRFGDRFPQHGHGCISLDACSLAEVGQHADQRDAHGRRDHLVIMFLNMTTDTNEQSLVDFVATY